MSGAALIYCRVSTRKQEDEGTSLETQEAACVNHALELGYSVGRVTREVYSGAELWDRPQLTQDRAEIREGKFQALVAYATDRLSRDPIHLAILAEECERRGVELLFVTEPLDNTAEGALIRYVKGYAAQIEREKIRERNMRGKHARIHAGNVPSWGYQLFGYRLAGKTATKEGAVRPRTVREVYEPEAAVVRRIFRLAAEEGLGSRTIASRLTAEGVPAPSAGKRRTEVEPRWSMASVRRILGRTEYKGESYGLTFAQGADMRVRLPDDATPPIVSEDVWQAAQDGLKARTGAVRADRRDTFHQYLLRGLIFCAICGRRMEPSDDHGCFIYRCSSRNAPEGRCTGKAVRGSDAIPKGARPRDPETGRLLPVSEEIRAAFATLPGVDRLAWEAVAEVLSKPETIREALLRQQTDGPDPVLQDDLAAARRGLAKVEQQQQRFIRRFGEDADGTFPWELVEREVTRLEGEKRQLQATIADLEARLSASQTDADQLERLLTELSHLSGRWAHHLAHATPEQKRMVLEALKIQVHANGTETPQLWSPFESLTCVMTPQSGWWRSRSRRLL